MLICIKVDILMLRMTSLMEWTWRRSDGWASYRFGSVTIIFFCHLQLYIYHGNNLDSFLFFTLDHQRIALVYFIVALIEAFTVKVRPTTVRSGPYAIFNAYRWQWYTILILPDSSITLVLHISFHFAFSWFWNE